MSNPTTTGRAFTRMRFAVGQTTAPPYAAQALPPRPSFYQEFTAHQLVTHVSSLAPDWDGYGAAPIHPDTARNAHRALNVLLLSVPVPEITPNSNGTVSFEWQSALGYATLEIGRTRFSFFLKLSAGPTIPFDGASAAIPEALGSLTSALLFPAAGAQFAVLAPITR